MKNLAIITARSGSKRLPDKNIRHLCGKPLMAYTIKAALDSGVFEEVMVSTDSEKYAEIARSYGASVPFLRSEYTSRDSATSWETVEEVVRMYIQAGRDFDTLCLLQPTSPLRGGKDIAGAYALYEEKKAYSVVAVKEASPAPTGYLQLTDGGEFKGFPIRQMIRNGEMENGFYKVNGSIYIVGVKRFLAEAGDPEHGLYKDGTFAYLMEPLRSIDVDTELDFLIAENIMKYYAEKQG